MWQLIFYAMASQFFLIKCVFDRYVHNFFLRRSSTCLVSVSGNITCRNRIGAEILRLGEKRLLRKCENKLFPTPLSLLTPIVIRFMWGTFKKCFFSSEIRFNLCGAI